VYRNSIEDLCFDPRSLYPVVQQEALESWERQPTMLFHVCIVLQPIWVVGDGFGLRCSLSVDCLDETLDESFLASFRVEVTLTQIGSQDFFCHLTHSLVCKPAEDQILSEAPDQLTLCRFSRISLASRPTFSLSRLRFFSAAHR